MTGAEVTDVEVAMTVPGSHTWTDCRGVEFVVDKVIHQAVNHRGSYHLAACRAQGLARHRGNDPAVGAAMNALNAAELMARIENYGYALAQAANSAAYNNKGAAADARASASETYRELKADLYALEREAN